MNCNEYIRSVTQSCQATKPVAAANLHIRCVCDRGSVSLGVDRRSPGKFDMCHCSGRRTTWNRIARDRVSCWLSVEETTETNNCDQSTAVNNARTQTL